jgi:hypothetical protein
MKLKTSLPGLRLENMTLDKSGSVRLNEHEHKLILVPGWSGRWWRLEEIVHELILQTSDNAIRLTLFRTSSPPTSCQRLGPCPSRSWLSWSLPALKIGRRLRAREREEIETFINHQLTSIKDKIYLLEKTWNWPKTALQLIRLTARRSGWPWDGSGWSGRSCSSGHEIERPGLILVKNETKWDGVVGDADEPRSCDVGRGLGATMETKFVLTRTGNEKRKPF